MLNFLFKTVLSKVFKIIGKAVYLIFMFGMIFSLPIYLIVQFIRRRNNDHYN